MISPRSQQIHYLYQQISQRNKGQTICCKNATFNTHSNWHKKKKKSTKQVKYKTFLE